MAFWIWLLDWHAQTKTNVCLICVFCGGDIMLTKIWLTHSSMDMVWLKIAHQAGIIWNEHTNGPSSSYIFALVSFFPCLSLSLSLVLCSLRQCQILQRCVGVITNTWAKSHSNIHKTVYRHLHTTGEKRNLFLPQLLYLVVEVRVEKWEREKWRAEGARRRWKQNENEDAMGSKWREENSILPGFGSWESTLRIYLHLWRFRGWHGQTRFVWVLFVVIAFVWPNLLCQQTPHANSASPLWRKHKHFVQTATIQMLSAIYSN